MNGWVVERHGLGAVRVIEFADVVRRNLAAVRDGEEVAWVVWGWAPTLSQAREVELEVKRMVRKQRDGGGGHGA